MTPRELIALAAGALVGVVLANVQELRRDNARRELERRTRQFEEDTKAESKPTDAERVSGWRETAKLAPLGRKAS